MSDTFVSVLEREPDWVALPAATPASIRTAARAVPAQGSAEAPARHRGCDPRHRRCHAPCRPARPVREAIASSGSCFVRVGRALPWLAASALAAALAWVGWLYYRAAGALPTEPVQLTIHPPEGVGVSLFCAVPGRPLPGVRAAIEQQPQVVGALARHRRSEGAAVDGRRPRVVLEARQPGNRLLRAAIS